MRCIVCNGKMSTGRPRYPGRCNLCVDVPTTVYQRPDLQDDEGGSLVTARRTDADGNRWVLLGGNGAAHRLRRAGVYPDGSVPRIESRPRNKLSERAPL